MHVCNSSAFTKANSKSCTGTKPQIQVHSEFLGMCVPLAGECHRVEPGQSRWLSIHSCTPPGFQPFKCCLLRRKAATTPANSVLRDSATPPAPIPSCSEISALKSAFIYSGRCTHTAHQLQATTIT